MVFRLPSPYILAWESFAGRAAEQRAFTMPKGPSGQKRPADVVSAAVMVARIATGEIEESSQPKSGRVRSRHAGVAARAAALGPEKRQEIAKKAASKRWSKNG